MEFDNIETIKQAVEIGAGRQHPAGADGPRGEPQTAALAAVRLIAPELRRPIGIIHRQRKVFTPTAAKFVELLQAECRADGDGGRLMREAEVPVTFQPPDKTVYVLPGTGCWRRPPRPTWCWMSPCGGEGHLRQVPRAWSPTAPASPRPPNAKSSRAEELRAGCRLACQMRGRRAR